MKARRQLTPTVDVATHHFSSGQLKSFWINCPKIALYLSLRYFICDEGMKNYFGWAVQAATTAPVHRPQTWESSPRRTSMKKNTTAHSGEMGMFAIPSGYDTNARPGPGHDELQHRCIQVIATQVHTINDNTDAHNELEHRCTHKITTQVHTINDNTDAHNELQHRCTHKITTQMHAINRSTHAHKDRNRATSNT